MEKENANQSQVVLQLQEALQNERTVTQNLRFEIQRQTENNEKLINRVVATGADLKAIKKNLLMNNNNNNKEDNDPSIELIRKVERERKNWVEKENEYKRVNKQLREDLIHLQNSRDFQLVQNPGYVKTIHVKAIEALKKQLNEVIEETKLFQEFTFKEKHFQAIQLAVANANLKNEKKKTKLYRQEVTYLKFLCKKSFAELAMISKQFYFASPISKFNKKHEKMDAAHDDVENFLEISEIPLKKNSVLII